MGGLWQVLFQDFNLPIVMKIGRNLLRVSSHSLIGLERVDSFALASESCLELGPGHKPGWNLEGQDSQCIRPQGETEESALLLFWL
jgi:hypothetical protein